MIEVAPFLALLHRLVGVSKELRGIAGYRARVFREIVEPLFRDLQPVVDDYFTLFHGARDTVFAATPEQLRRDVLPELRKNREALLATRIKVREMSNAIAREARDAKVAAFCRRVSEFFYRKEENPSMAHSLIEFFDAVEQGNLSREQLLTYITHTLRELNGSWSAIAQAYASLRIYCLVPRRFRRR